MKIKDKEENNFKKAFFKSGKMFWKSLPLILGTILLVSLIITLVPKTFYFKIFTQNIFSDSFIGSLIGSISAGNPITSYILGGELLTQGVSLIAVTAFLVAWVTGGIVQLPAESMIFGKKFAIWRNVLSFIFAIIVALITFVILGGILW